jgi:hypothetical protein
MKFTAALAIGLCLIASTGHAQGWLGVLGGLGNGIQNGEAQRYNMQHGYPAYIQPPPPTYDSQSQSQWPGGSGGPSYYILNGRTITCVPLGNGMTSCR